MKKLYGTYEIVPAQMINLQNQLITGQLIKYYNLRDELTNIEEYVGEEYIQNGYTQKE